MTPDEFVKKKYDPGNMLTLPTEPQEALDILIEQFLGKDWYVTDPLPTSQVNTYAVHQILSKYQKRTLFEKIKSFI